MRQRRIGLFLAMVVALVPLTVYFLGCGGGGSGGGGGVTTSRFVFVANSDASSVSVFRIQDNGALESLDNVALAADSYPTMIALHPNGKFLYVVNSNASGGEWGDNASIGAYAYSADTGAIAEIEGSPFGWPLDEVTGKTGSTLVNMAITPDGRFLYAGDVSNEEIMIFSINASTGALTLQDEIAVDNDPQSVAVSPSGKFLFVGLYDDYGIQTFAIQGDGSLIEAEYSPYTINGNYVWLALTPDGKYMYAAGVDNGAACSINGVTGELTVLGDVIDTSLDEPKSAAVTPDGKYVYTANFGSGTVGAYRIMGDGTVDADTATSIQAGKRPKSVTVTRDSKYLYVANYGDATVTAFCIDDATGELELIDTYPVEKGPKFLTALP